MNQTAKTTHLARLPAGNVKKEPDTGPASLQTFRLEEFGQLLGSGDRRFAGEALADVGAGGAVAQERRLGAARGAGGEDEVGAELSADRRGQLGQVVADQGHLLTRSEVEVEGAEQVGEGLGVS